MAASALTHALDRALLPARLPPAVPGDDPPHARRPGPSPGSAPGRTLPPSPGRRRNDGASVVAHDRRYRRPLWLPDRAFGPDGANPDDCQTSGRRLPGILSGPTRLKMIPPSPGDPEQDILGHPGYPATSTQAYG